MDIKVYIYIYIYTYPPKSTDHPIFAIPFTIPGEISPFSDLAGAPGTAKTSTALMRLGKWERWFTWRIIPRIVSR